jgi:hypothetical protein
VSCLHLLPMLGQGDATRSEPGVVPVPPLPYGLLGGVVTDVTPHLKADPGPCPCDDPRCDKVGRPSSRIGHVRGCACRRCIGKRNRKSGLARQSVARKALGVPGNKFGDANEENWSDNMFANEVKSGKQCGPLETWFRRVEGQVLANRADHGDRSRPVRAVAMPEGWGDDGIVAMRLSAYRELVRPALDEFYGPEGVSA